MCDWCETNDVCKNIGFRHYDYIERKLASLNLISGLWLVILGPTLVESRESKLCRRYALPLAESPRSYYVWLIVLDTIDR